MSDTPSQKSLSSLRVGVVGAGSMGKNLARIFGELPDCQFSVVLDERAEVARDFAVKFHARAVADLDEFTNSVDAATIATPTFTHFAIAKHLLEHGKHVLVEKPFVE